MPPTTAKNKAIKATCKKLYIDDDKSIAELSLIFGVPEKTIYRWSNDEDWSLLKTHQAAIESKIEINLKLAIVKGLEEFAKNPGDKDLQSLVSLLKQFTERHKPTLAYKDNIMKFLSKTKDYFLEKEMKETAQVFSTCVIDLAEYLLRS